MKDVTGGYWGIVIVISAFMIQVIAFGISLSFGVYNIELLTFTEDAFAVSLVSAINIGVLLGSGPICSFLMQRMTRRSIVLVGAGLSSAGLLCMPFLPSLGYMYVIDGGITDFGFSLVLIPSHVLCGLYFVKHQSLVTGFAVAGLGMGLTVFPIIVGYLIKEYTWRPSFFILAGFALNLFVFGSLLRPLPKTMLPPNPKEQSDNSRKCLDHFSVFRICIHHQVTQSGGSWCLKDSVNSASEYVLTVTRSTIYPKILIGSNIMHKTVRYWEYHN